MFEFIHKDINKLESDLKLFASRAVNFANRSAINTGVFETQKIIRTDLREKMILRNKFTERSIQFELSKSLQIERQAAFVGSTEDYMEDQEFGGIKMSRGKHGVPLPTTVASGEGLGNKKRTRLPRARNKLRKIKLSTKRKRAAKSTKQANVFAVQDAVMTGKRVIFLELGKTKGIFRVKGGSKKFKRGWPKGAKIRMLYDLSNQSVNIKPTPWLRPAVNKIRKQMPEIYFKALLFQKKRLNLFD